jgi:hypothetical protein
MATDLISIVLELLRLQDASRSGYGGLVDSWWQVLT